MSDKTIEIKVEHINTFSLLHGELPIHFVDEINKYIDNNNEINLKDDVPAGLCNLLNAKIVK